jgi:hypothetical protein
MTQQKRAAQPNLTEDQPLRLTIINWLLQDTAHPQLFNGSKELELLGLRLQLLVYPQVS